MLLFKSILFALFAGVWCKPNFVIIMTDDQDVTMGGMTPMKNVKRLIGEEGMTFTNSFSTSPVCCPSRASFLTGMHLHNHGAINNTVEGGCYGGQWRTHEARTFATTLKDNGYSTFYAGKYLNRYGQDDGGVRVPPGWSEWHGLVSQSRYYNYTISNNGVPTHSDDLYLTDVIRDLSLTFIENLESPFLMVLSPPAPHSPFTPAPRHKDAYIDVTVPKTPHYNIKPEEKHWLMNLPPTPLPDSLLPELDRVHRNRWETLLAVDEMVVDVMEALKDHAEDTYFIFTSDNGYHIGQFSQIYDKRQPYESDIRVPLLIKGPSVPRNATSKEPVLNIDLAPTVLKLAGFEVPEYMDGRVIDVLGVNPVEERAMLVEYFGEGDDATVDASCQWKYDTDQLMYCRPESACKCEDSRNNTYACVRRVGPAVDDKYCEWRDEQGFIELYDLTSDPYEMRNLKNETMGAFLAWYHHVLGDLVACRGASCHQNS